MHADDSTVSATGDGASPAERLPRTGSPPGTKSKKRKTAPPPVTVNCHPLTRWDHCGGRVLRAPRLDQLDRPEDE